MSLGVRQPAKSGVDAGADTARAWVARRVQGVGEGLLVRGDGVPVAVLRVEPAPFALLSARERGVRIAAAHEALRAVTGRWQVVSVQRPVDLDSYVTALEGAAREAGDARRAVLRAYAEHVRQTILTGGALEVRHFLLLEGEKRPGGDGAVRQAAGELAVSLARGGLTARAATTAEAMDMLHGYLVPSRAPGEGAVVGTDLAPIYRGVEYGG